MIEVELFTVTKEPDDLDIMSVGEQHWLAREIKRLDDAGLLQPSAADIKAFLEEHSFEYVFVQEREKRTALSTAGMRLHTKLVLDVKVSVRFENDTEGLYFKMWKSL